MIDSNLILSAVFIGLSYLLGSISFGMVTAKLLGLGDLRSIGSGNIGATNVMRTGNHLAGVLTLCLDGAKGALAVFVAATFVGQTTAQLAGFAAFVGHLYPVWLRFKGGKGVASYIGVLLALVPLGGLLTCLIWLISFGDMEDFIACRADGNQCNAYLYCPVYQMGYCCRGSGDVTLCIVRPPSKYTPSLKRYGTKD